MIEAIESLSLDVQDGEWTSESSRVLCQLTWGWCIAQQQIGSLGDQQGNRGGQAGANSTRLWLIFVVLLDYWVNLFRIRGGSKYYWAGHGREREKRGSYEKLDCQERRCGVVKGPTDCICAVTVIWGLSLHSDTTGCLPAGPRFHSSLGCCLYSLLYPRGFQQGFVGSLLQWKLSKFSSPNGIYFPIKD